MRSLSINNWVTNISRLGTFLKRFSKKNISITFAFVRHVLHNVNWTSYNKEKGLLNPPPIYEQLFLPYFDKQYNTTRIIMIEGKSSSPTTL